MMLEVEGLFKVFGANPDRAMEQIADGRSSKEIFQETGHMVAVSDVSLSVPKGEIFVIMGLSGSGKSTLIRCLNRLIEPSAGKITIDGEDVTAMPATRLRELRRTRVAMVFQNFALLPHKTIHANVELGLLIRGEKEPERRQKAQAVLEQVGLAEWGDHYPGSLSGGMKQRVGLARALANDPDILLMDEPFSALDPLIRSGLQDELLELQRTIRKTIVFITHDFHEAVKLGNRIAVMKDGRFVQVGSACEIVTNSADDYVRNFSRDVDRGRVLSAGDLASMSIPVLPATVDPAEARSRLEQSGGGCVVLVDGDGRLEGYVQARDLAPDRLNGHADCAHLLQRDMSSVAQNTPIIDLYGLLAARRPVAITDDAGRVLGAVDAVDILGQLGQPGAPQSSPSHETSTQDDRRTAE